MSDPPRATWDPAMPTAKDRLRFDLGDTNVGRVKAADADALQLPVDDAVYEGVLARRGNDERQALIDLADALVNRYAQEETRAELTGIEVAEWKNRLDGWKATAARARAQIGAEEATAAAGFRVLRPTRAGAAREGGEYYGGRCRAPWED